MAARAALPPYGVRRQSEAATALSLTPRRSQSPKRRRTASITSGVLLWPCEREPDYDGSACRLATLWSAPAERSGDGAFLDFATFTKSRAASHCFDNVGGPSLAMRTRAGLRWKRVPPCHPMECAGRAKRRRRFP